MKNIIGKVTEVPLDDEAIFENIIHCIEICNSSKYNSLIFSNYDKTGLKDREYFLNT